MKPVDIIIGIVVLAVIGLAVWGTLKNKKAGKSCSCGCTNCPHRETCHDKKEKSE